MHGSKAMLQVGNVVATTVEAADEKGFHTDPALPFFVERYAVVYRAELVAFVTAIQDRAAPSPSGIDGLKAQMLADDAAEAAICGRAVTVG